MPCNTLIWIGVVILIGASGCNPKSVDEKPIKLDGSFSAPVDGISLSTLLTGRVEQVVLVDKLFLEFPSQTNEIKTPSTLPLRAIMLRFKRPDGSIFSAGAVGRASGDLQLADHLSIGQTYALPGDLLRLQEKLRENTTSTNSE